MKWKLHFVLYTDNIIIIKNRFNTHAEWTSFKYISWKIVFILSNTIIYFEKLN